MDKLKFERDQVNNIRLHVLPTDRFKTYAISVFIGRPLAADTVTPTALIPLVLRRGTEKLPETMHFRQRLDDLYGAAFVFDIFKRGDYQIAQFKMDVIHDQFVSETGSLIDQALEFMGEAITAPANEHGQLLEKYVESEKNTLHRKLETIINDKTRYAAIRNIEEMCKNEPYRLNPMGVIDDIARITAKSLTEDHKDWISTTPIDLYVVGQTTMEEVKSIVNRTFKLKTKPGLAYTLRPSNPIIKRVNTVEETMQVSQGKLNMGFRTNSSYGDHTYPASLMYNGILGGYSHSKLFKNVREKFSLAYYVSSQIDSHKGIMTIQSGIEPQKYEQAIDIIQEQLVAMNDGEINELELHQTRAMLANSLQQIQDSAYSMISFDFNAIFSQQEHSALEMIESINSVTISDIQQFAKQVQLDTIYFLRGPKGE